MGFVSELVLYFYNKSISNIHAEHLIFYVYALVPNA